MLIRSISGCKPFAGFAVEPRSSVVGTAVAFADASTGLGDEIVGWLWDFGDGETAVGREVQHDYADPGVHEVILTITVGGEEHRVAR